MKFLKALRVGIWRTKEYIGDENTKGIIREYLEFLPTKKHLHSAINTISIDYKLVKDLYPKDLDLYKDTDICDNRLIGNKDLAQKYVLTEKEHNEDVIQFIKNGIGLYDKA